MKTVNDYLALITDQHADKPKYRAIVGGCVQPFIDAQQFLANLPSQFDLDIAVGVQLDAVGQWAGISRTISVPIVNVFFAFDDVRRGFDLGYWQTPYAQSYGVVSFDDDIFRQLIRARIIANQEGDGSVAKALKILGKFLSVTSATYFVYASDWGLSGAPAAGATLYVCFVGNLPSYVYMIIIQREYLPIRGAGVDLQVLGSTVSGTAMFGFDVQNQYISGFDVGSFGAAPAYLADQGLI